MAEIEFDAADADAVVEIRRELTDQYAALWAAMPGFRDEPGWYCIWSSADDLRGFWVDDSPEFIGRTEMHLCILLEPAVTGSEPAASNLR